MYSDFTFDVSECRIPEEVSWGEILYRLLVGCAIFGAGKGAMETCNPALKKIQGQIYKYTSAWACLLWKTWYRLVLESGSHRSGYYLIE
jgi:hypothetical protein